MTEAKRKMETETKQESNAPKPEEIVRKYIDAKDRHDWTALVALLDPDYMSYDPTFPEPVKGIEPLRKFFEMLEKVGMKTRVISMMSKGDTVAAELEVTCTIRPSGEIDNNTALPSDHPFVVRFAKFYRVNSKGLLAEEREYSDTATKLQTLGSDIASEFQAIGAKD